MTMHAGSGLGLPLCNALLQQMGGSLTLTAQEEGTGAVFTFDLTFPMSHTPSPQHPQERFKPASLSGTAGKDLSASAAPRPADPPPKLKGPIEGEPLRVLMADDLQMNRSLLKLQLNKIFAETDILEVETGEEALTALLGGVGYDIAFLDEIFGPHPMRGLEVTRQVRAAQVNARSGKALPIIGCSGNAGAGHTEVALAVGQNLVWGKPTPSVPQLREQLAGLIGLVSENNT